MSRSRTKNNLLESALGFPHDNIKLTAIFISSYDYKTLSQTLGTDMRAMYILTSWFLLSTMTNARSVNVKVANSYETVVYQRRSRDATKPVTKVFSHIPCELSLAEEDKIGKKTLDEIHTFAELKNDPRASFPDSFTVCSSMIPDICHGRHGHVRVNFFWLVLPV